MTHAPFLSPLHDLIPFPLSLLQILAQGVVVIVIQTSVSERRVVSGIRCHVTAGHTEKDIDRLAEVVSASLAKVLRK